MNRRQLLARAAALSAALAADPFMSTRGHPTGRTIEAKEAALSAASSLESELDTSTAHLGTWGGLLPTAAIAAAQQGDGREGSAAGAARRSRGTPPYLVERRTHFLIDVARGHAHLTDDSAAMATLLAAERLASDRGGQPAGLLQPR